MEISSGLRQRYPARQYARQLAVICVSRLATASEFCQSATWPSIAFMSAVLFIFRRGCECHDITSAATRTGCSMISSERHLSPDLTIITPQIQVTTAANGFYGDSIAFQLRCAAKQRLIDYTHPR